MKDIISMNDMAKEEILEILEIAEKIENTPEEEKLKFLISKHAIAFPPLHQLQPEYLKIQTSRCSRSKATDHRILTPAVPVCRMHVSRLGAQPQGSPS